VVGGGRGKERAQLVGKRCRTLLGKRNWDYEEVKTRKVKYHLGEKPVKSKSLKRIRKKEVSWTLTGKKVGPKGEANVLRG